MNVRPFVEIIQNYDEIADLCRKTSKPVILTNNGQADLVVIDRNAFNRREKVLKLREELVLAREDRLNGLPDYPAKEVVRMMREAIRQAQAKQK